MNEHIKHLIEQVELARRSKDIKGLEKMSSDATYAASRCYQMIGDLYREEKNFLNAAKAYTKCTENSAGALYGEIESWKNLGNHKMFSDAARRFVKLEKYSATLLSRVILAAAEMQEPEIARILLDRFSSVSTIDDPRVWVRVAKALIVLDERDRAQPYISLAQESAVSDENLQLEIAALNYDLGEYWELRYNTSQGDRTPVPVADQSDDRYNVRRDRDTSFVEGVFNELFADRIFNSVADCGCGSGRLTPFLSSRSVRLDCFDISPTAIKYARGHNSEIENVTFEVSNLSEESLPRQKYDLVFDFTAVQHVVDQMLWNAVLINYVQSLKPGGFLFLVQYGGNDIYKHVLHVSSASIDTYISTIEAMGCTLEYRQITPTPDNPTEECIVFRKRSEPDFTF